MTGSPPIRTEYSSCAPMAADLDPRHDDRDLGLQLQLGLQPRPLRRGQHPRGRAQARPELVRHGGVPPRPVDAEVDIIWIDRQISISCHGYIMSAHLPSSMMTWTPGCPVSGRLNTRELHTDQSGEGTRVT